MDQIFEFDLYEVPISVTREKNGKDDITQKSIEFT